MRVTFEARAEPLQLRRALEGFVRVSQAILRDRPGLPRLYASGTRYTREPRGRERWQSVEETIASKQGDCEDLVIARVAELRERDGIVAHPHVYQTKTPGLLHTVVRMPDGSLEDPSLILGMGRNAPDAQRKRGRNGR